MADRSTVSVRIALEGGAEIKRQLGEIGSAFEGIGTAANRLVVSFQRFGSASQALNSSINRTISQAFKLTASITGAVAGFTLLEKSAISTGDAIRKGAQDAQVSAQTFQGLQFASAALGGQADTLTNFASQVRTALQGLSKDTALDTFTKGVQQNSVNVLSAANDFGRGARLIKDGIQTAFSDGIRVISGVPGATKQATDGLSDLQKLLLSSDSAFDKTTGKLKTTDAALTSFADAFAKLPASSQQTLGLQLFGKDAADLVPILARGGKAIDDFRIAGRALGLFLTDDELKALDTSRLAFAKLGTEATLVKAKIGAAVAPVFTDFLSFLSEQLEQNVGKIKEFAAAFATTAKPVVADFIAFLAGNESKISEGSIFKGLRVQIADFADGLKVLLTSVIVPTFRAIKTAADGLSVAIKTVFGTDIPGSALIAGAAILQFFGIFKLIASVFTLGRRAILLFADAVLFLASPLGAIANLVKNGLAVAIETVAVLFGRTAATIATIAGRIIGLVAIVDLVIRNFQRLKDFFSEIGTGLADIFKGNVAKGFSELTATATKAFTDLKNASLTTWAEIAVGAVAGVRLIAGAFAVGLGPGILLAGLVAAVVAAAVYWDDLKALAVKAFDAIAATAKTGWDAVVNVFRVGGTLDQYLFGADFSAKSDAAWQAVKNGAQSTYDFLKVGGTLDKFIFGDNASQLPAQVFDALKSGFVKTFADIKAAFDDFIATLTPGFALIDTAARAVFDALLSYIKGVFHDIGGVVGDVVTYVKGAVLDTIGAISDGIDKTISIIGKLKSVLSSTGNPNLTDQSGQVGGAANSPLPAVGSTGFDTSSFRPSTNVEDRRNQTVEDTRQTLDGIRSVASEALDVLTGMVQAFGATLADAWKGFADGATVAVVAADEAIRTGIVTIGATLQALPAALVSAFASVGSQIAGGIQSALQGIEGAVTSTIQSINSQLDSLTAKIQQVIAAAQAAANAAASAGSSSSASPFATGGYVSGAGTGTSDSIPAWLSNGEFVLTASAVRRWGTGLLHAMNAGSASVRSFMPKFSLGGLAGAFEMPRFAAGGLVNVEVPAYAGASAGGALHPVHIHMPDGRTISGLLAPKDVADSLQTFLTKQSVSRI